jgi:hypothetical protein
VSGRNQTPEAFFSAYGGHIYAINMSNFTSSIKYSSNQIDVTDFENAWIVYGLLVRKCLSSRLLFILEIQIQFSAEYCLLIYQ